MTNSYILLTLYYYPLKAYTELAANKDQNGTYEEVQQHSLVFPERLMLTMPSVTYPYAKPSFNSLYESHTNMIPCMSRAG